MAENACSPKVQSHPISIRHPRGRIESDPDFLSRVRSCSVICLSSKICSLQPAPVARPHKVFLLVFGRELTRRIPGIFARQKKTVSTCVCGAAACAPGCDGVRRDRITKGVLERCFVVTPITCTLGLLAERMAALLLWSLRPKQQWPNYAQTREYWPQLVGFRCD